MRPAAAASFVHRASGSRGRFRNCRQLAQSSARPENSRVPDPTSNTAFLRVSGTGEGRHVLVAGLRCLGFPVNPGGILEIPFGVLIRAAELGLI
jgi:hypothetical protein